MSLLQLRSLVALYAGPDLYAKNARVQGIIRRRSAKWLDESFFALLHQLGADAFLECGARDATASQRFVAAVGAQALAAEANPLTWAQRTRKAEYNGVATHNCGIGARDGETLEFFMPADYQMAGSASFMRKPGEEYVTERIETRTIDRLWRENFSESQTVALWIDVEGMASEALQGAETLLDSGHCVAIKVEVERRALWTGQRLACDVDAWLDDKGYVPVLCDFEYDFQFNAVYVRQDAVDAIEYLLLARLFGLLQCRVTLVERIFKSRRYLSKRRRKLRK